MQPRMEIGVDSAAYQAMLQLEKYVRGCGISPNLLELIKNRASQISAGQVRAALKPLHGAMKIARFMLALRSKWLSNAVYRTMEINGQPGAIFVLDGCINSVTTFEIVDGYIQSVYTVRNLEKLIFFKKKVYCSAESKKLDDTTMGTYSSHDC